MSGSQTAGYPPAIGHNGGPMLTDAASLLGFNDAEQRIWTYFLNQVHRIDNEVFEIEYPDIRYQDLIPVDTQGGEWVQAITYFSTDRVGAAQWFHAGAQDVPLVGMLKNQYATTVQMAAIGYDYNEEELAIATQLGQNLTNDKASVCRRAAEEFIDRVAMNGDTATGFQGLINSSAVTASTVSGGVWSGKTGDAVLADINAALAGIWTGSSGIELADTLLLPQAVYADLLTRARGTTTDTTIMEFVQKANIYTAQTGRALTIRGLWGLNTAGSGSSGRMIAYRRDRDVLRMHIPMPFQFRQPWRKGPLMYQVPGIFRLGGLDIRRPGAMRYIDGIM